MIPEQRGGLTAPPRLGLIVVAGLAAAGLAAAGLLIWRPGTPAAAPGAVAPMGGAHRPQDGVLDRQLTSSQDAFKLYQEGVGLARTLPAQAAARFRGAVLLDPAFYPAYHRLALAAVQMSRRDEARSAIRSATLDEQRLPEPYRTEAPVLLHYIDGAFDLASRALKEAIARLPDDPELHFIAGRISAESCDYFDPNATIEHFERVLASDPEYAAARGGLIEAYEMKSMHEWSLARATEYRARHLESFDAIAELGRVRIARGEYGDAIEDADEIVQRGADVFAYGLGPAFILAGHHEQLAAMYDPEMERTSTLEANVLSHLHAGVNDVWTGRFGKAVEHFERGPEFLPGPWQRSRKALFYLLLGRTNSLLGRGQEARSALEAAEQVAGPQPVLEYALGVAELHDGRTQEAQRVVKRLEDELRPSQPGWTEPWRRLMAGEIALAAGDAAQAVQEFREAWKLQRPLEIDCIAAHTGAYFLDALGRGLLATSRPQDALQAFEHIRSLGIKGLHQPEIAVLALYRAGLAYEAMGREEDARERYRAFLDQWGRADVMTPEIDDARARLSRAGNGG
jgi:tetratricopeptide (TPR) repeat protein